MLARGVRQRCRLLGSRSLGGLRLEPLESRVLLDGGTAPLPSVLDYPGDLDALSVGIDVTARGGDCEARDEPTHGGHGGRVDVRSGVDVDVGDGSDGDLTHTVTLTSGTYNYRQVIITDPSDFVRIWIDGDVTINCQGMFMPNTVAGVFHPDSAPPTVRINAGLSKSWQYDMVMPPLYHSTVFLMTPGVASFMPQGLTNSDGSGIDGGTVEFYTTEPGALDVSASTEGSDGANGGNGGDGGEIVLVAKEDDISAWLYADGGNGAQWDWKTPGDSVDGGAGGDAGTIVVAGSGVAAPPYWLPSFEPYPCELRANGGEGAHAADGTEDHADGFRGGDGGRGGGIRVEVSSIDVPMVISACGGDGGNGGSGRSGRFAVPGDDGGDGGDGGRGGAAGTIEGASGEALPGDGGDGAEGGWGTWGEDNYSGGPGGAGGNGGHGGAGGDAGGEGATPGLGAEGGIGGLGGYGAPSGPAGQDGSRGPDGGIAFSAPISPPQAPNPPYSGTTYVLCVGLGTWTVAPDGFPYYSAGDVDAENVANAFAQIASVHGCKVLRLSGSRQGNELALRSELKAIKSKLRPGDTLVFYYSGHGGVRPGPGPEHPAEAHMLRRVQLHEDPWQVITGIRLRPDYLRDTFDPSRPFSTIHYWVESTGDEVFWLSDTDCIEDTDFASIFAADSAWCDVDKLFIFDCCYAGGLWGDPGASDLGDLASLPNSALIAASTEGEFANEGPAEQGSYYVHSVSRALVAALEQLKDEKRITFGELYAHVESAGEVIFHGKSSGRIAAGDVISYHGYEATVAFAPVGLTSAGFELTLGDEPCGSAAEDDSFGNIDGRNVKLRLQDTDGTWVTFAIKGPGAGTAELAGEGWHVYLTGTTPRSTLRIATKKSKTPGDDGQTAVFDVAVDGSLKQISAKTTDLLGALTVDGWLGKATFGDVAAPHSITIGGSADDKPITLVFDRVQDLVLASDTPIKALTVTEWLDTDATPDQIIAPWLGKLTTKGRKAKARKGIAGLAGDFEAGLVLSGTGDPKLTLGKVKIAGSVTKGAWTVAGPVGTIAVGIDFCADLEALSIRSVKVKHDLLDSEIVLTLAHDGSSHLALGKLSVAKWIRRTHLVADTHLGTITAGGADDLDVLVSTDGLAWPADQNGFDEECSLKKLLIKGIRDGKAYAASFLDTRIAAWSIGKAVVREVETENGGEPFGFRSADPCSVQWFQGRERFRWPGVWPEDAGDFVVEQLV